jgi:hypothetical protein
MLGGVLMVACSPSQRWRVALTLLADQRTPSTAAALVR